MAQLGELARFILGQDPLGNPVVELDDGHGNRFIVATDMGDNVYFEWLVSSAAAYLGIPVDRLEPA